MKRRQLLYSLILVLICLMLFALSAQTTAAQDDLPSLAGNSPFWGKYTAPITIVEFADLECPYCRQFHNDTHGQLRAKYEKTGQVRFVFRHFPIPEIHASAVDAAVASECAREQGRFWRYVDAVYALPRLSHEALLGLARQVEMPNMSAFETCLKNQSTLQLVSTDKAAGVAWKVKGTPTFFINGKRIDGAVPFITMDSLIQELLLSHPPSTPASAPAPSSTSQPTSLPPTPADLVRLF